MEVLVIWVVLAVIAGVVASGKGRSGVGWFLFAIVLSPLIGLLVVALLPSKKPMPAAPPRDDPMRTIAALADLRDRGALPADEYEAKKADLLARV